LLKDRRYRPDNLVLTELTKKSHKKRNYARRLPVKEVANSVFAYTIGVLGTRSAIADFRWKYRDYFHPCWWTVVGCIVTYLQTC